MNYNNLISLNIIPEEIAIVNYKPTNYLKGCNALFEQEMHTSMKIWLILLDKNGKIHVENKIKASFLKDLYQSNINFIAYFYQGTTHLILHNYICDFPKKIYKNP